MVKDERGFALPMVLILITALSVLGLTLLGASLSHASRTMVEEKREKAFYLAKSGADAVATHIIDNYNTATLQAGFTDLNNHYLNQDISLEESLGKGKFRAQIYSDPSNPDIYRITSKGQVDSITSEVTLTLGAESAATGLSHAILASGYIKNHDDTLTVTNDGTIAAGGLISGPGPIVAKEVISGYTGEYPPTIPFPDITGWIPKPITSILNTSGYYGTYQPASSEVFTIENNSNNDMHIVFDSFLDNGGTVINISGSGSGTIHIYANNVHVEASISIFNTNSKKVVFHVKTSISLKGSFYLLNVLLYAPEVDLTATDGSVNLTGAMVVKNLEMKGNSVVNYDPDIANIIKGSQRFKKLNWSMK